MRKEWKATTNKHVVAEKEKTRVEEVQEAEHKEKEQQPNEWQLVKSKSARKVKQQQMTISVSFGSNRYEVKEISGKKDSG